MRRLEGVGAGQVGDAAGDAQNSVIGALERCAGSWRCTASAAPASSDAAGKAFDFTRSQAGVWFVLAIFNAAFARGHDAARTVAVFPIAAGRALQHCWSAGTRSANRCGRAAVRERRRGSDDLILHRHFRKDHRGTHRDTDSSPRDRHPELPAGKIQPAALRVLLHAPAFQRFVKAFQNALVELAVRNIKQHAAMRQRKIRRAAARCRRPPAPP